MRRQPVLLLLLSLPGLAWASGDEYLGVASCASAMCHAAPRPLGEAGVAQDEYLVWLRRDRHADAYRTLLGERSRAIAERLGGEPAHLRRDCLGCHAPRTAGHPTGPRFRIEDGVDCESCHGPAGGWIDRHVSGYRSVEARLADGMYPTWDRHARAALCASCHVAAPGADIGHEVMAAGHPELRFELDTFVTAMPPHFPRGGAHLGKPAYDGLREWVAGQIGTARAWLERLSRTAPGPGLPELAVLDCHGCHHDMHRARWMAGRSPALPVGHPRLQDQSLVLIQLYLDATGSALAGRWRAARRALDRDFAAGDWRGASTRLIRLLDDVVADAGHDADPRAALLHLLAQGQAALAGDFALAEQLAMAAAVMVETLEQRARVADRAAARAAVDALFDAVADSRQFDPMRWRAVLRSAHRDLARATRPGRAIAAGP